MGSNRLSYIVSYANGYSDILYTVALQYVGNGKILYRGEYNKYYLVIVDASNEDEAIRSATTLVHEDSDDSGRKNLLFPNFKDRNVTNKMVWGATKSRKEFIEDHLDRFNELADKLDSCDKWNWGALHENKVTSQEYVVLFSDDAGDMYARGICSKYYDGKWHEEEYGDSFD